MLVPKILRQRLYRGTSSISSTRTCCTHAQPRLGTKLTASDKSKAPTYEIKKIPGDLDTQIIVFSAGPPYEDIAFRIVRRPWEYSHRSGFRSLFDKGVLQRKSHLLSRSCPTNTQSTSTSAATTM
jgi:hypothetical protein